MKNYMKHIEISVRLRTAFMWSPPRWYRCFPAFAVQYASCNFFTCIIQWITNCQSLLESSSSKNYNECFKFSIQKTLKINFEERRQTSTLGVTLWLMEFGSRARCPAVQRRGASLQSAKEGAGLLLITGSRTESRRQTSTDIMRSSVI